MPSSNSNSRSGDVATKYGGWPCPVSFGLAVGAAVLLGAGWYRQRRAADARRRAPTITQLFVFPIKGARGFSPDAWPVTKDGFKYDREWVVLKEGDTQTVITLRNCPRLATVAVAVDEAAGKLVLSCPADPSKGSVSVPLVLPAASSSSSEAATYSLWGTQGGAHDEGDAVAAWLSGVVGQPVRLYHTSAEQLRDTREASDEKRQILPPGHAVRAHDFTSFMVIAEQTAAQVRDACGDADVGVDRFRGNIVIDTATPGDEYRYRKAACAGITFTFVKYCTRCVVPSVRPDGTNHPKYEPTRTLRERFSLRPAHDPTAEGKAKPVAGINMYHEGVGTIRVGDTFTVTDMVHASPTMVKEGF